MKKIIPVLITLFFLSGCYNGREPNDIGYITAVGIDKGEDKENYNFTIQFAKPTQISGGASEEGGSGGDIVENITVEAPTLYSAIYTMNHIVSKSMSMAHIKLVVFSDEVAREGVGNITQNMMRSEEIRPHVYLAVAKDSAGDYLSQIKPIVEINPTKYYQLIFERNHSSGIPKNPGQDFYFYENLPERDSVMPVVGTVEIQQQGEQNGEQSQNGQSGGQSGGGQSEQPQENPSQKEAPINLHGFEYGIKDYMAGEVGVKEKVQVEAMGMAVFSGDKLAGYMGSIESGLYNIISGSYTNGYITFKSKKDNRPITVRAELEDLPKIEYNKQKNSVKIRFTLDCDFVSLATDYLVENDIRHFESEASELIEKTSVEFLEKTREMGTDIIGIGSRAKMQFLTNKQFRDFNWQEKYKSIEFEIEPKIKIRRAGITLRSEKKAEENKEN